MNQQNKSIINKKNFLFIIGGIETMRKTNNKPSFEEWYNSLSKPAKKAFKVGVQYALKCIKENQQLEAILSK